jgi:RimJ/RimL family protein N-acetyltransferase
VELVPDPPVETPRLRLRPFTLADLDALHAIHSREDVTRYLYWGPRTREEVRRALVAKLRGVAVAGEGDGLAFAVERRDSGELIGDCSLWWASEVHRQGEIGFLFHPAHHGRGFATEAGQALLALAFDGLGLHRVTGRLDGRNAASAAVLERLGMRREGHLVENEHVRGVWTDELVYALLDREWRARGGAP